MSTSFPHPFGAIATRFRAYRRKLPGIASGIAASDFRNNFRRQGYLDDGGGVRPWAPRQDAKGKGRAILVKTGRLRRAIRAAPTFAEARVINNTPYARIHNRGGAMRGSQRTWQSNVRSRMARLRSGSAKANMPARPFMITTKPLLKEIGKRIQDDLATQVFQTK